MTTWVAFLRAVNVGRRRTPMPTLVDIATDLGGVGAWTFANTGNLIFESDGDARNWEDRLETAFLATFDFEVTTFVRSADEVRQVVDDAPFAVADDDTHLIGFLKGAPSAGDAATLRDAAAATATDTIEIRGATLHWRIHGKTLETAIPKRAWTAAVGPLGMTTRNVTLLRRLVTKLGDATP